MKRIPAAKDPTRNVWLQLGFPDAEEHFLKAELVLRLDKEIKIGATKPKKTGNVTVKDARRKAA